MIRYSLTIQESHAREIRQAVLPGNGNEGVAYLLCGQSTIEHDPWDQHPEARFYSREVIQLAPEDLISSSPDHVHAKTRTLVRVLKRAAETDATPVYVHGHPGGFEQFSSQDDADEPALVELTQNRNGKDTVLLSVVFSGSGRVFGRVWQDRRHAAPLSMVRVIGNRIMLDYDDRNQLGQTEELSRQALAFGPALNADIGALRFGIVGCGATGSAVALLLARLGARQVFAIDDDTVEKSNLNRLHGATSDDLPRGEGRRGTPKVIVLKRSIESLGLDIRVATEQRWVGDPACRDALRSCDVLFGCTDDHDGRMLLNRVAYFYLTPLIDMGIGIDFVDGTPPRITHAESRVTVAMPGTRCLLCRGIVDPKLAQEDDLLRRNPEEYHRLRQRGELYVRGGGRPNPAVVTFTTGVACMAVDELIQRLTGYRAAGSAAHRVYKHHLLEEKRPGAREGTCRICGEPNYWGRGDMLPYLDRTG